MASASPLRICIDARLEDGPASGIRTVLIGLANAFSSLEGEEQYYFLAFRHSHEWLKPHVFGRSAILSARGSHSKLRETMRTVRWLRRGWTTIRSKAAPPAMRIQESDGTIEEAGIDLMYFALTAGFRTDIPSIYQIHDLQHLHYPQYFSPLNLRQRDFRYREMCSQAKLVTVPCNWGKCDLSSGFGIPEDKIEVVPWAPVLTNGVPEESDLITARKKYSLPQSFAFYPAYTWPHKNHLGLLESLAFVRDRYGEEIPLICSGDQNDFMSEIRATIVKLGLERQVKFLGYVSALDLRCLYKLCRIVVFPSFFEGWGLPLLEACASGTAVTCSDIGPFKEQAVDVMPTFDPHNVVSIAEAIRSLWGSESYRRDVIKKAHERSKAFTWECTARLLRAHFRAISGRQLGSEDKELLNSEVAPC